MIQNDNLYRKKAAVYPANSDRPIHNSDGKTQITDDDIDDRIAKFGTQIDNKYMCIEFRRYTFVILGKLTF